MGNKSVLEGFLEHYSPVIAVALALLLVYLSYTPSYTSGYLETVFLDREAVVYTPFKTDILVSLHSLLDDNVEYLTIHGFTNTVLLGSSREGVYAIVRVRGLDIYTVITSVAMVLLSIHAILRFKSYNGKKLKAYTVSLVFTIAIALSIYTYTLYTSTPYNIAYTTGLETIKLEKPFYTDNASGLEYYLIDSIPANETPAMYCICSSRGVEAILFKLVGTREYSRVHVFSRENKSFCGHIGLGEKAKLVLVIESRNRGSVFHYSRVSIVEIKSYNPYIVSAPAILLLAETVFIELYSRGKPRSSPSAHQREKQLSLEEEDQSSSTT